MTEQRPLPPPLGVARLGGAMYLVIIVLGIFGEVFVRQRLIVANDAMATAANIRAHELLWRWSVATHAVGAVSSSTVSGPSSQAWWSSWPPRCS